MIINILDRKLSTEKLSMLAPGCTFLFNGAVYQYIKSVKRGRDPSCADKVVEAFNFTDCEIVRLNEECEVELVAEVFLTIRLK